MIHETIDLLGRRATDRVTGFSGVITTVSFDLYGCVQAVITPQAVGGKMGEGAWFDVGRLAWGSEEKVMQARDFAVAGVDPALYDQGAAEKPPMGRL